MASQTRPLPRTRQGPSTARTGETACPTGRSRASVARPDHAQHDQPAGTAVPGTGSNVVRSVPWLLLRAGRHRTRSGHFLPAVSAPARANAAARTRPGTRAASPAAPRRPATGAASPSATPRPPSTSRAPRTSSTDCCEPCQTVGRAIAGVGRDGARKSVSAELFREGRAPQTRRGDRGQHVPDRHVPAQRSTVNAARGEIRTGLNHDDHRGGRRRTAPRGRPRSSPLPTPAALRRCGPLVAGSVVLKHPGDDLIGPRPQVQLRRAS